MTWQFHLAALARPPRTVAPSISSQRNSCAALARGRKDEAAPRNGCAARFAPRKGSREQMRRRTGTPCSYQWASAGVGPAEQMRRNGQHTEGTEAPRNRRAAPFLPERAPGTDPPRRISRRREEQMRHGTAAPRWLATPEEQMRRGTNTPLPRPHLPVGDCGTNAQPTLSPGRAEGTDAPRRWSRRHEEQMRSGTDAPPNPPWPPGLRPE